MSHNGVVHSSPPSHARKSSSGSRSSLTAVPSMPVITEDEATLPQKRMIVPPRSSRRGMPPEYVPTLHPPPKYSEKAEASRWDEAVERVERRCGVWNRRRWCCCLAVTVVVLLVLGVALGVGLGVGLRKKKHQANDDTQKPDPSFPAGSYTFDTTLRNTTTSCTTNPSTWRCYPYSPTMPAPFFWIITELSPTSYTISSTDNPFAPTFSNLTLTQHDASTSSERWTFAFAMSKTVVPSEALTSDNKAASCTFGETLFEGTLWTRGEGQGSGERFGMWPGDVEVVQRKVAAEGEQVCVESSGEVIAGVEVGEGDCECVYASFDDA